MTATMMTTMIALAKMPSSAVNTTEQSQKRRVDDGDNSFHLERIRRAQADDAARFVGHALACLQHADSTARESLEAYAQRMRAIEVTV